MENNPGNKDQDDNSIKFVKSPAQAFRESSCIGCMDSSRNNGLCASGVDDIMKCIRIFEFLPDVNLAPSNRAKRSHEREHRCGGSCMSEAI